MGSLVTVGSYGTAHEAALAKARLAAAGIPSTVIGEHHARVFGGMGALSGTVDVQVHADDEDAARSVLALDTSGYDEDLTALEAEAENSEESESAPTRDRCPRCGSDSYTLKKYSWGLIFLCAFLLFIPLLFIPRQHECGICGNIWKA